jgi:NAD+ diphosphatase
MPSFFDFRIFSEASHLNGFSGNRVVRWSEGRDEASLASALAAADAGIYLFVDDRALLRVEGERLGALFTHAGAELVGLDPASLILLGVTPEGPRFAGSALADVERAEDIKAIDLRSLAIQGALDLGDLAALAQARSYLYWHAGNRFCGRCGGELAMLRGGVSRICKNCGTEFFPRVDPVVIMLAVDGERCLLGRQPRFAPGMYSALAGFLEPGETIEEAVRREVKEEAGIAIGRVAYHSSQAWPFPSSLMIGCHAEALSATVERDAAELEDCRWFSREEVQLMLSDTHPEGLKTPPRMAIAHQLIATFARWEEPS